MSSIGDRQTNCGHCHVCGRPLREVLDGEEWCDYCGTYRRYRSHGWAKWSAPIPCRSQDERAPFCPTADELEALRQAHPE